MLYDLLDLLARLAIAGIALLSAPLDSPLPLIPALLLYAVGFAADDFDRVRLNAR